MNERYQTLAALKGPALKCLIVFCWERRQMTITELATHVGHDDQTVRQAMRQLELYGLAGQVINSQETWHLTDCGYQLPLPLGQLSPPEEREKFSPLTTTTTSILISSDELSSSSSRNAPRGEILSSPVADNAAYAANLQALHRSGIRGKKADTLSRLEWVTPEYVTAHVEKVRDDGGRLGLAICRIEDGDPMPEPAKTARDKYIGGKYAEFISH